MTAFLHGQSKIFLLNKKDIQRKNILRPSNSKAPNMGKRYFLTSYNVDDVTKHAPCDGNGNVTLMAQGAKQDFAFRNLTNAPIVFSTQQRGANIPNKNTSKLRNNVNPSSKKFDFSRFFFFTFCVLTRKT